jgi:hypothetical protein
MDSGLKKEFGFYARREKTNELLFSIGLFLGAGSLLLLAILLLFLNGLWLLILVPGLAYLIIRLVQKPNYRRIAKGIEAGFALLRGKVINALELSEYQVEGKEGYSQELIRAVVADGVQGLKSNPITTLINRKKTKLVFLTLAGVVVLLCSYTLLFNSRFSLGLYAAFAPDKIPIQLIVEPGTVLVNKGSVVDVTVRVISPYWFSEGVFVKIEKDGKAIKSRTPLKEGTAVVRESVAEGFDYYFQVFQKRSLTYRVGLQKPLEITNLKFIYHYPPYTRLAPFTTETDEIYGLVGTKVEVVGSGDEVLASGECAFTDSSATGLQIDGKDFQGEFSIAKETEFAINLQDRFGNRNEPKVIKVSPLGDQPPLVKLFVPGRDVDLPVNMKVLLGINALDDYGLGELWLCYEKGGAENKIRLKGLNDRIEDTTFYYWDLTPLGLMPGEVINYYALVSDNDQVSGPKSSRSEVYSIRFPTVDEIYKDVVSQTTEIKDRLEPISSEQDKLGEEAKRIEDKLKKERELDWAEKKNIENLLSHQEQLLSNIDALKQEVDKALENLQQGMLLDKESLDKLKDIENLLSEILPDEVKRSLNDLRRSLEKDYPKIKDALANWKLSQEALKKAIDRTLEILKRIEQEERLKAMAQQAEELHKLQKDIQGRLEKEPGPQLAHSENQVKEGLEGLEQEAKSLAEELKDEEIAKALSDLAKAMEEQGLAAQASQLTDQLQSGGSSQAKQSGQKLLVNLADLKAALAALKDKFLDKRSKEIAEKLLKSAKDILTLSKEQERLEGAVKGGDDLSRLAEAQQTLASGTKILAESIYALSQQSVTVSPQIGSEMIKSLLAMDEAKKGMASANQFQAQANLAQARSHLDQATAAILAALNQGCQGSCSSGSGELEQLMEQLSQLSLQQMMLNQQSGGILPIPMPGGGLSQAQLSQIQRILSQQSKIRGDLEGLSQSMSEKPGLLGTLDKVVEEMKKVEQDLASLNISRETLERQEKILTRLLDAQKSVRQREFSKKRESEVGKDTGERPVPVALPEDKGERRKRLREELLRALKAGYPKEYEALIKAYFEALVGE